MYKLFSRCGSIYESFDFTHVLYDSYGRKIYFKCRSSNIGFISNCSYFTYVSFVLQIRLFRSIYTKRMLWS